MDWIPSNSLLISSTTVWSTGSGLGFEIIFSEDKIFMLGMSNLNPLTFTGDLVRTGLFFVYRKNIYPKFCSKSVQSNCKVLEVKFRLLYKLFSSSPGPGVVSITSELIFSLMKSNKVLGSSLKILLWHRFPRQSMPIK